MKGGFLWEADGKWKRRMTLIINELKVKNIVQEHNINLNNLIKNTKSSRKETQ